MSQSGLALSLSSRAHGDDDTSTEAAKRTSNDRTSYSTETSSGQKRLCRELVGWNNTEIMKPARFLPIHLDVLHLLHKDDPTVDEALWEMTKNFLQKRSRIMKAKKKSEQMNRIHMESVLVSGQKYTHPAMRNEWSATEHKVETTGTLSMSDDTPRVRNVTNLKSSPVMLQSSLYLRPPQGQGSHHSLSPSFCLTNGPGDGLHQNNRLDIVACLIGERSELIQVEFQRQAQPFQSLLQATDSRIAFLRQQLIQLQQSLATANDKCLIDILLSANVSTNLPIERSVPTSEDSFTDGAETQNKIATLEYSIRLWSLLVQDLREATQPCIDSK